MTLTSAMSRGIVSGTRRPLTLALLVCCVLVLLTIFGYQNTTLSLWRRQMPAWEDVAQDFSSSHSPGRSWIENMSDKEPPSTLKPEITLHDKIDESNDNQLESSTEYNIEEVMLSQNDPSIEDTSDSQSKGRDSRGEVEELGDILSEKLSKATVEKIQFRPTCHNNATISNSCDKKCLQTNLPEDATKRVAQLVQPSRMQLTSKQHEVLRDMADKVKGYYDVILLTAASSNHYLESQTLIRNLHQTMFPKLKNFTLIFYNIGLEDNERATMVRYCRCQVIDFPFEIFPDFMKNLKCYTWKPVIIKTHLHQANILIWLDASIRFDNPPTNFPLLLERTRERGLVFVGNEANAPSFTHQSMYHFFGDERCAYLNLQMALSGFGAYHNEYFVERAVLEPWVACALNETCMFWPNFRSCSPAKEMEFKYRQGVGPLVYGNCHRYDQSGISIIIHKLYQDSFKWIIGNRGEFIHIKRGDKGDIFPDS